MKVYRLLKGIRMNIGNPVVGRAQVNVLESYDTETKDRTTEPYHEKKNEELEI